MMTTMTSNREQLAYDAINAWTSCANATYGCNLCAKRDVAGKVVIESYSHYNTKRYPCQFIGIKSKCYTYNGLLKAMLKFTHPWAWSDNGLVRPWIIDYGTNAEEILINIDLKKTVG